MPHHIPKCSGHKPAQKLPPLLPVKLPTLPMRQPPSSYFLPSLTHPKISSLVILVRFLVINFLLQFCTLSKTALRFLFSTSRWTANCFLTDNLTNSPTDTASLPATFSNNW